MLAQLHESALKLEGCHSDASLQAECADLKAKLVELQTHEVLDLSHHLHNDWLKFED